MAHSPFSIPLTQRLRKEKVAVGTNQVQDFIARLSTNNAACDWMVGEKYEHKYQM